MGLASWYLVSFMFIIHLVVSYIFRDYDFELFFFIQALSTLLIFSALFVMFILSVSMRAGLKERFKSHEEGALVADDCGVLFRSMVIAAVVYFCFFFIVTVFVFFDMFDVSVLGGLSVAGFFAFCIYSGRAVHKFVSTHSL